MENVKISVILPVYNAENTLERAVKSVLAQEESEFELIIVNDGSEDKSGDVIKAYEEKDSRVRGVAQKNAGPLAAIRSGIRLAKGGFVAFIDADDEYHKQYLSELYRMVSEQDADISVCGYFHRTVDGSKENKMCRDRTVYERKDIQESLTGCFLRERKLLGARWNKMYKKELVENALKSIVKDFNYGEDVVMVLGTFLEATKIAVSEKCLYYYYDTEQSLEKRMSGTDKRMASAEEMYKNTMDVLSRHDRMDLLPDASYYHYTEVIAYFKLVLHAIKTYDERRKKMKAVLKDPITCHALKYAKKRTWKSHVIIWVMKRRWILLLMILLKIAD